MADQDLLHTTEIMKAALPYIDTGVRGIAELFVKTLDLMASIKSLRSTDNLAACGFTAGKIDIEGLLNGIRPVCNNRERQIIDRILGFFNMKRMFDMYNKMMDAMKNIQDLGGFSFEDAEGYDDTTNVTDNLGSSNFQSIFETFRDMNFSGNTTQEFQKSSDLSNDGEEAPDNSYEDNLKEKTASANSFGGKPNNMMLELLKTMVPPEQMSTFESLSMLLNSMSYDNNSNEENKEQSDG